MDAEAAFTQAELDRRLANLLRIGTVAQADYAAARVRVQSGELLSAWLPWLTQRAGQDSTWWAPEIGEQVVVLSPSGEPAAGVVLGALYQQASPPPASRQSVQVTQYADGTRIVYDQQAHHLSIHAVGDLTIHAAGTIRIEGQDVRIEGRHVRIEGQDVRIHER